MQMLEYAIDNFWKGPEVRDKAFEILAMNEAQINSAMGITDDDLLGINDDDDFINGLSGTDTTDLVDDMISKFKLLQDDMKKKSEALRLKSELNDLKQEIHRQSRSRSKSRSRLSSDSSDISEGITGGIGNMIVGDTFTIG
jgi:hypothetical protein